MIQATLSDWSWYFRFAVKAMMEAAQNWEIRMMAPEYLDDLRDERPDLI